MDGIPEILYKYRDWNDNYHQGLLKENELFLASAGQFNDPFDVSLPFRYREADLTPENLFLKLIESAKNMHPDYSDQQLHHMCFERQNSGAFDDGQYWREHHEGFKERMHAIFGIVSLTTKNDNLLMWSHYANSHRGFCIGLDSEMVFNEVGGTITPVFYDETFPEIPLFGNPVAGMIQILATKSTHWGYEDEYRLMKINAAKSTVTLPDEAFKEIILGLNMNEDSRKEIIQLVRARFPNMKIYQSQMNEDEFKVNIIPIL